MKRVLSLVLFLVSVTMGGAQTKTIVMNMSPGGYPPYMIYDQAAGIKSGIMYDVMLRICHNLGYGLEVDGIPRNRVALMLADGSLDVTERAMEWENDPSLYVFSDPVLYLEDHVFAQKAHPLEFKRPEDLAGQTLVTILGFSYPELDPLFKKGLMTREDAKDALALLQMVQAGRVDGAVLHPALAWYTMKVKKLDPNQFSVSQSALNHLGYRFMFSKRWQFLMPAFNKELKNLVDTGEMAKILDSYK